MYPLLCWCCLVSESCLTLKLHGLYPTRLLCPWDFSGKNTLVGCHLLLQRSSWPRDWSYSQVSCSGRWVLYYWATREAPLLTVASTLYTHTSVTLYNSLQAVVSSPLYIHGGWGSVSFSDCSRTQSWEVGQLGFKSRSVPWIHCLACFFSEPFCLLINVVKEHFNETNKIFSSV